MKVAFVNPPVVCYSGDLFGGIPSIPVGLLYVAAAAREAGHQVTVHDSFIGAPTVRNDWLGEFEFRGLGPRELADRLPRDAEMIAVSAHSGGSHRYTLELLRAVRERGARHTVVGGPFASASPGAFLGQGADHVIVGEGERSFVDLLAALEDGGDAGPSQAEGGVA